MSRTHSNFFHCLTVAREAYLLLRKYTGSVLQSAEQPRCLVNMCARGFLLPAEDAGVAGSWENLPACSPVHFRNCSKHDWKGEPLRGEWTMVNALVPSLPAALPRTAAATQDKVLYFSLVV